MRQSKLVGAVILAIIVVAAVAAWTALGTRGTIGEESGQTVKRSEVLDDELFD